MITEIDIFLHIKSWLPKLGQRAHNKGNDVQHHESAHGPTLYNTHESRAIGLRSNVLQLYSLTNAPLKATDQPSDQWALQTFRRSVGHSEHIDGDELQ